MKAAICKVDIFYEEMPVFLYNSETDRYEHLWSNGNRILFYSREEVEEIEETSSDWIIFEIDKNEQQYRKIKGDF